MEETVHPCFCDLAPLYALGGLSEPEQIWVERQARQDADLALELEAYQDAAAALAYGLPERSPAPDLKVRLFERIGAPLLADPLPVEEAPAPPSLQEEGLWVMEAKNLTWQPHDVPGVEIAIIHLDLETRTVVGMLRAQPGVRYPLHRHAAVEELYMLQGDLRVGTQVYGPGDYLRSTPNTSHSPITTNGCQFFFRTSMDDEYLEAVAAVG